MLHVTTISFKESLDLCEDRFETNEHSIACTKNHSVLLPSIMIMNIAENGNAFMPIYFVFILYC